MSQPAKQTAVDDQKVIGSAPASASREDKYERTAVGDYSGDAKNDKTLRVRVYSPFNDYYSGMAFSLSAENAVGPFDILPHHHNFISLLQPCELVIRTVSNDEQRIKISGGLLHVKADQAVVFLDV